MGLAVKGMKKKFVFQGVHMMFAGGFRDGQCWKEGEERECRFVFIGKNIKQKHGERLRNEFLTLQAEHPLRFGVGDMVKARSERGWQPARVIKLWDEGNPYRL